VASDAQKFRLIEVEGEKNVYNLQLSDGRYVTRNGWRIQIGNDPTSSEAKFTAELVSVQEGTVRFREYTGVNFLGTDNMTDGSEVYGNKGNAAYDQSFHFGPLLCSLAIMIFEEYIV
jgi:hypothetical protein